MDINNITSSSNKLVNKSDSSDEGRKTEKQVAAHKNGYSDKISLNGYSGSKNEQIFAKIELEKLNSSSFDKLKKMKTALNEFEAAKSGSPEKASETKIGQMLNNPDVWEEIAGKIID